MTLNEILAKLELLSPDERQLVRAKVEELLAGDELARHQVASGEGAVIPGDEALLQQAQPQQ
jgi:hypothetical protein